jgi:ferritin-like metal-binding protein YciE
MENSSREHAHNNASTQSDSDLQALQSSQLMELFEKELEDVYWAEKALIKALPKMIENATSRALVTALSSHLSETEQHVVRLEQVFQSFGKKASAEKCEAMKGILAEAEDTMDCCEEGAMRDAGIIACCQKAEHYEIATYGTLRQFAATLGLKEAASLLEKTLKEEKAADEKLSDIAMSAVNLHAAVSESNS